MARRHYVHVSAYRRRFPQLGADDRTRYNWENKPQPEVGDEDYQGRLWSGGPASPREKQIMAANAQANAAGQQVGQYIVTNAKKDDSGWLWILLLLAFRKRR